MFGVKNLEPGEAGVCEGTECVRVSVCVCECDRVCPHSFYWSKKDTSVQITDQGLKLSKSNDITPVFIHETNCASFGFQSGKL